MTVLRNARVTPYAGLALLALLVVLYPTTGPSAGNLSLATSALVFGLAATGLGLLWGQSGQVSIAHAAVFGVGAYAAALLYERQGIGFLAALPLSAAAGAIAAGLIALTSLRTKGHYFVILTFAVGQVLVIAAKQLEGLTGGSGGLTLIASDEQVFGLSLVTPEDFYTVAAIIAFLVIGCVMVIMRSRWGVTLRGIRDNPDLAISLGTNVARSRVLVFVVSGAIAGLAGQLFVYHLKFIEPTLFDAHFSIFFLLMVLLGGRRYLLGPLIGAAVYVFLPSMLGLSPVLSQMVFGLVLIAVILLFPQGLLSARSRIAALLARHARGGASADAVQAPDTPPPSDGDVRPVPVGAVTPTGKSEEDR